MSVECAVISYLVFRAATSSSSYHRTVVTTQLTRQRSFAYLNSPNVSCVWFK